MAIYFTSDTHFGHNKDFILGPRGFADFIEAGNRIVENWNSVVGPDDEVYFLGDFMLNKDNEAFAIECIKRLNGTIHWILGNHDSTTRVETVTTECDNIASVNLAVRTKIGGYNVYMSHYPTLTGNYDDDKCLKTQVISLFGHTHQDTCRFGEYNNMYHVGLDSNELKPVSWEHIIETLKGYDERS